MTLEDYNTLNDMLLEFRREAGEADVQIDYNLRCIREAEVHLKSYQEMETDDFRVFSPRKAAIIHKEEIDKICDEKARCEEINKTLYRRREIINKNIVRLESVLSHQSCNFTAQAGEVGESFAAVPGILEDMLCKINRVRQEIDRNPIQARQNIAIIERNFRNLADKWKDIVSCEKG